MEQREKVIDKTPAQKIRDYFKEPKWRALTKKQEKRYGRIWRSIKDY